MISDAHIHLDERIKKILVKDEIPAIISCTTPQEVEEAIRVCNDYPFLSYSCGLHPWSLKNITWNMMEPYMKQSKLIGEIGMDSVWCDIERELQIEVFTKQLYYASKFHKPVILHTKGEEKTIANIIKQYPNTYLVHWYSCMEHLQSYKEMSCYFSVGPDIVQNESVRQVVKEVDISYLVIESDGISAIEWAIGKIEDKEYQGTLYHTAQEIAQIKNMDVEKIITIVNANYQRFVK